MVKAGVLIRDDKPRYYVYRLTWNGKVQTGLAAVASLADYATNRVRKHELTTPVKENDRVRQIEAVNAQTGPVMMGYPPAPAIDAMLAQASSRRARGRRHRRRRRAPPDVGGRRRRRDRRAHARVRRAARDLHCRRPPPLGRRRPGRAGARRRGLAQPFPVGDLSASPDDHPRLQPRAARSQRPQCRAGAGRAARSALRSRRPTSAVRPASAGEFGMYPRRPLVPADDPAGAHSRRRSDRAAADHAAGEERPRRRSSASPTSAPTSASISSAAGAGLRSSSAA